MKKNVFFLVIFLCLSSVLFFNVYSSNCPKMYFCTAANHKYFDLLQNLIGSIHATNYESTEEIAVFDLGLTDNEKDWLNQVGKVSIHKVELTHPDILKPVKINGNGKMVPGWYAWKPVVIKQALDFFPYVLWIDAGMTVLQSLDNVFAFIEQNGYFLTTIGSREPDGTLLYPVDWGTTQYIKNKFELDDPENKWILNEEFVNAALIGVKKDFINSFIFPLYELSNDLKNYIDDGTTPNGFGTGRYEQTLLSIYAYSNKLDILNIDYTQRTSTFLSISKKIFPFYLTWHANYVSDNTTIFHSRTNINNKNLYMKKIYYK